MTVKDIIDNKLFANNVFTKFAISSPEYRKLAAIGFFNDEDVRKFDGSEVDSFYWSGKAETIVIYLKKGEGAEGV